MRKFHVVGNWKMHGSANSLVDLVTEMTQKLTQNDSQIMVGVCPPFVYLQAIDSALKGPKSLIRLGAQDVSSQAQGAYTGQVSASMLRDLGCLYVLVGHSERRHGLGEGNDLIAAKVSQAIEQGLTPIVCVGETLAQRESDMTEIVVLGQLAPVLELGPEVLKQCLIAYEPVWAIGTGKSASSAQAQDVHSFIRKEVAKVAQDVAQSLPILYGGSVKPSNALELMQCSDIDGALIGGASLNAQDFIEIIRSAQKVAQEIAV